MGHTKVLKKHTIYDNIYSSVIQVSQNQENFFSDINLPRNKTSVMNDL